MIVLLLFPIFIATTISDENKVDTKDDDIEILKEEGVLVLKDNNFDTALEKHEYILVEFYAPWCGHCQELAPKYEEAAKELINKESIVKLAKIDTTAETAIGERFQIEGFPTLKFFKKGIPVDYNGDRETEGILSWIEKKMGAPFTEIKKKGELKEILKKEQAIVVGFFKDLNDERANIVKDAADANDDIKFFLVSEKEVMQEYHQNDGSIIVLKTFDEKEAHFMDKLTKENLDKFVRRSSMPLVNEFTQENADKIFSSDIVKHFLLFSQKNDIQYGARIETLRVVAKEYRDKMIFVHLDIADEDNEQILEFFGVKPEDCPTFSIFEIESSSKYLPPADKKEITASTMGGFIKEYLDGKLVKFLKSASLPADWNEGAVKVLVGDNFNEVARDKTKNVFVEFFAPWCGHCQKIAPIWEEVGEKYKENSDMVIAKIDAVDNEVDEIEVDGFPTFKMFKKETNEVVDYVGKRDFENIVKFIETGEQEEVEEEEEEGEEEPDYPDDEDDLETEEDDDFGMDEEGEVVEKSEGLKTKDEL